MQSMEQLESALDDAAIRILELANELVLCKMNVENYVKSGCMDLAKARYINGNRSISSLQLPNEDNYTDASFKTKTFLEENILKFRRHSQPSVNEDDGNGEKRFPNDPLKWFGVLVPQSLRQAKTTFEKCLEIVVECANVQSELKFCMENYENLKMNLKLARLSVSE